MILVSGYLIKNNATIKQTALGVLVFSSLTAIPAYFTGEGAEEIVEEIPGVAESAIEVHEDLGKIFLIVALVLGALSLVTLLSAAFKLKITSLLYVIVLVAAIGTGIFAKEVGTSGGEIRHTEIRSGNIDYNKDIDKDDD